MEQPRTRLFVFVFYFPAATDLQRVTIAHTKHVQLAFCLSSAIFLSPFAHRGTYFRNSPISPGVFLLIVLFTNVFDLLVIMQLRLAAIYTWTVLLRLMFPKINGVVPLLII